MRFDVSLSSAAASRSWAPTHVRGLPLPAARPVTFEGWRAFRRVVPQGEAEPRVHCLPLLLKRSGMIALPRHPEGEGISAARAPSGN